MRSTSGVVPLTKLLVGHDVHHMAIREKSSVRFGSFIDEMAATARTRLINCMLVCRPDARGAFRKPDGTLLVRNVKAAVEAAAAHPQTQSPTSTYFVHDKPSIFRPVLDPVGLVATTLWSAVGEALLYEHPEDPQCFFTEDQVRGTSIDEVERRLKAHLSGVPDDLISGWTTCLERYAFGVDADESIDLEAYVRAAKPICEDLRKMLHPGIETPNAIVVAMQASVTDLENAIAQYRGARDGLRAVQAAEQSAFGWSDLVFEPLE